MSTFHVSVVTPERAVLEAEARFVALPAHDGELGVLPGRAPIIVKLGVGRLKVDTADGRHLYLVDGGFAEMVGDRLTILTELARTPDELDRAEAAKALEAARQMTVTDDASFEARQRALAHAREARQLTR